MRNRLGNNGEGETALPEAVALFEFAHRDDTIACPQSVCVTQDLSACYATVSYTHLDVYKRQGLNSPDGVPLLKNLVDRLLRQRADVLAFHSAPAAQGGTCLLYTSRCV